jgi:hypothetical protein
MSAAVASQVSRCNQKVVTTRNAAASQTGRSAAVVKRQISTGSRAVSEATAARRFSAATRPHCGCQPENAGVMLAQGCAGSTAATSM